MRMQGLAAAASARIGFNHLPGPYCKPSPCEERDFVVDKPKESKDSQFQRVVDYFLGHSKSNDEGKPKPRKAPKKGESRVRLKKTPTSG